MTILKLLVHSALDANDFACATSAFADPALHFENSAMQLAPTRALTKFARQLALLAQVYGSAYAHLGRRALHLCNTASPA